MDQFNIKKAMIPYSRYLHKYGTKTIKQGLAHLNKKGQKYIVR